MPAINPDTNPEETISYTLRPHQDLWQDWKHTVPRDTALHTRLFRLLEYDTNHDLDALVMQDADLDAAEGDVSVTMMRIRHRCMSAIQDAREQGADDAAESLKEIQGMATQVLEGGE